MSDDTIDRDALAERYVAAAAVFGNEVVALLGDEWALPTPCPDWDVRTVVAHVVLGEAQVPDAVDGRPMFTERSMEVSILGRDPVAAWRGTALRAIEAVRRADPDRLVAHPGGSVPLARVLGFRIVENLAHAWDIGVARGEPPELDAELAEWALDFLLPHVRGLADADAFGPIVAPLHDTPGARLLALLGRGGSPA